jgi:putative membrane protein
MVMRISDADAALVQAAVTAAEATTDGEIATIVAPQSDAYNDVVLHWALLAMLLALAGFTAFPGLLLWLRGLPDGGWRGDYPLGELLFVLLLVLAAKFLVARFVFGLPALRFRLAPRATRQRRVRRRAIDLFKAGTEARTLSRTGVLLYLSLAEHRAEIVADAAIASKVSPEAWGEAMAALLAGIKAGEPGRGMADAVSRIGAVLSEHFPRTGTDPDEMPDRLIRL